jgi:hypothetical protein
MSRAKNTIKQSEVSSTPIKVKYSATYNSQSLQSYGITTNRGQNIPVLASMFSTNQERMVNYRTIRQLYYQNYLTGSVIGSASYWDPMWQSTAASGSFDDEYRYFPSASDSNISFLAIPTTQFGEQISRNSFSIASTDTVSYNIIDDGNGNLVDTLNGSVHVGNIFYAQGIITFTNNDYVGIILNCDFTISGNPTITLTSYGNSVGPFDIYYGTYPSNDTLIVSGITLQQLLGGYTVTYPGGQDYLKVTNTDPYCGGNSQFIYLLPPSVTPSISVTPTISITPSETPSITPSTTPTVTVTTTPSVTRTVSITPSITPSETPANTVTPSVSVTNTPSRTPSVTPSITPTNTPTNTVTPTPSVTPSITVSETPSVTPSITTSVTPSVTPTITISPTPSTSNPLDGQYYQIADTSYAACFGPTNSILVYDADQPLEVGEFLYQVPNGSDKWTIAEIQALIGSSATTFFLTGGGILAGTFLVVSDFSGDAYASSTGVCATPSAGLTPTPTTTPSVSPSNTPSVTPSSTATPSISVSNTPSVTQTPSVTPSETPSITPSITPSNTPSVTPSVTATPSNTPSVTPSNTISVTPSTSISVTPSNTPSVSITPSITTTPSVSISETPSVTPSISISNTPSITPSNTPSISISVTPSHTPTITASTTPSITPTRTPSVTPSVTTSITPTSTPSNTPPNSVTPSISLSRTPSITPTISISSTPSVTPSISISNTPSVTPSISISSTPSVTPTISISNTPSNSITPSNTPSVTPTRTPSISISNTPSISVTPTISISNTPSVTPSISISNTPSVTPSISISNTPSVTPSISISNTPSITPSVTATPTISITPSITATPSITISATPSVTPSTSNPLDGQYYNIADTAYAACFGPTTSILIYDADQPVEVGEFLYQVPAGTDTWTIAEIQALVGSAATSFFLTGGGIPAGTFLVISDNGGSAYASSSGTCVSPTPTTSVTPSITPSVTATPSISISSTPSVTPSISISSTPSVTPTISISNTPSVTPSVTATPTISITPTVTSTPTISISSTPSVTPTASPFLPYAYTVIYQSYDNGYVGYATPAAACGITSPNITVYSATTPFQNGMVLYLDQGGATEFPVKNTADYFGLNDTSTHTFTYDTGGPYVENYTVCVTPTPTTSITPSQTPSITPSVTATPSETPSITPSVTPSETPSITPSVTPSESPIPITELIVYGNYQNVGNSVEYQVNGGGWFSLGSLGDTNCVYINTISGLSNGDTVEFRTNDSYAIGGDASTCPNSVGCTIPSTVVSTGTNYYYLTVDGSSAC